jgi:hypothetical protein
MPKRLRYSDRLRNEDPIVRLRDVHLLVGGTGAVGGATLLKMLRIYSDLRRMYRVDDDVAGPVIVATGHDQKELDRFRTYIYDVTLSASGYHPTRSGNTLRMPNGGLIELHAFKFEVLAGLPRLLAEKQGSLLDALLNEVRAARSFTDLLAAVDADIGARTPFDRYRSVQIGIPLPSLLAYHLDSLDELEIKGLLTRAQNEQVKEAITLQLVEQLRHVRSRADHVIVAHTTAVGGMYDIRADGERPVIRLGFAHAAIDSQLAVKRQRAEQFSELYRKAGIWNLVTAAAIGVDNVAIDEPLKLQKQMEKELRRATREPFPGASSARFVHVHSPKSVGIKPGPSDETPLRFDRMERAHEFRPRFALRSGENGFLSVANAEALYRVMRVASPSELGTVMAIVGALGDDPCEPWFPNGECYYTETDNSRLVFDFLSQPQLRDTQLSGLQAQALVDLGSAKHQAELHTLGLLILLHRLRTLDLDAVPGKWMEASANRFDVEAFIEGNSSPLTFEDVEEWDIRELERDLRILALATKPDELLPLKNFRMKNQDALSGYRVMVRTEIFNRVLQAVWAVTSLGSPLVVTGEDGEPLVRVGWWVAPLSIVAESEGVLADWFKNRCEQLSRKDKSWKWRPDELANHHFAVNGFVDLRAHAIVASSKTDEALPETIVVVRNEQALERALADLKPFSFFSTCGLVAVLYRLKCLADYIQAAQSQIQLGTHHDVAWAIPRNHREHTLVVPGIVEALRMVSEGLEKATGTEILSGNWGYRWFA